MSDTTRRRFLGYLVAAPTLAAAASLVDQPPWRIPAALAASGTSTAPAKAAAAAGASTWIVAARRPT